jgi:tetratricopeptide (TPR) repeat protein
MRLTLLSFLAALVLAAPLHAQNDEQDWCRVAIMADSSGDPATAVEAYSHCLETPGLEDEYRGMFLHQRGLAYEALGEPENAVEDFTQALPLVLEPEKTFSARGLARAQMGQFDKAIYDFTQAINVNPHEPGNWHMRGILNIEVGHFDEALDDYDMAVSLAPDNVMLLAGRAELKARMGDSGGAIDDYGLLIKMEPRFAPAYNGRAWHRYLAGVDYAEALQDIEIGIALEPENTDFVDTQAHLLSALGRRDEALDAFLEAAELGGADRIIWYQEELAAKGYLDGEPNGELDTATREAFEACVEVDCRLLDGAVPPEAAQ